jgi:hypothetical protein
MASRNRGKQKPKLADLSRTSPTWEEAEALFDAFLAAPPIAKAIIGAAMVEHELEQLLRQRFARKDNETWAALISDHGPLATFDQKITAGYAFRIYDDATRHNLSIVRKIRNTFAHAKKPTTFGHELIAGELRKVVDKNRNYRGARQRRGNDYSGLYADLCMFICIEFGGKQLRAAMRRLKSKNPDQTQPLSPYALAMIRFLDPPESKAK